MKKSKRMMYAGIEVMKSQKKDRREEDDERMNGARK